MRFEEIIGNDELKRLLPQMVREGRLPHAVLFTEEGSWGALAFALALAQYVNCEQAQAASGACSSKTPETAGAEAGTDSCGVCDSCHKYGKLIHPDLHFVFPVSAGKGLSESEKKAPISDYFLPAWRDLLLRKPYFSEQELYDAIGIENKSGLITVNEAKRIIEKLSLRAFEGEYKTMIIYLPERMNADAANKLLKLIEEPPTGTLFLLVSHNPERILQTIRSRCQRIQLKPLSREERKAAGLSTAANPEFSELLRQLLTVSLEKKLIDTFPLWESLSEMGRERQRDWCLYAEQTIRKIYLVASGLEDLAETEPDEAERIRDFARRLNPAFYEKAFKALESVLSAIDSNVNPKLTFCNLANIFQVTA
ncbi:MAG: hypothetical protein IJK20_01545 [Bacteroidales bacterium]|nr:hypothetical protein [Bacteroidales bacterium]